MELPENKSQLVAQAVNRSTRTVKLAMILVIICAQLVFVVIPCILGIIKNQLDFKFVQFVIVFFIYETITFTPLVLTYFRFKTAYRECYSTDPCRIDILKQIDKQRKIVVIINICRSILLFGFLPEFPFDWIIQYLSEDFDLDSDLTEQYIKMALVSMIVLGVLFFIFGTLGDLLVFWLLLGKVCRSEKKPNPCIRCGNTIEVDDTNLYSLYCRACEKLRKEVEKAHFLPNPQQKALIYSYTKPLKYAAFMQHLFFLALFMKFFIWHPADDFHLHWILISVPCLVMYGVSELIIVKHEIYHQFTSAFTNLILFSNDDDTFIRLRKAKRLRNIEIVLIIVRILFTLLLFALLVKFDCCTWNELETFMKSFYREFVLVCFVVAMLSYMFFYLTFFYNALTKLAGPELCPWCARRPIVKQLESDGQSKEDERRRQFKSCEECLRM